MLSKNQGGIRHTRAHQLQRFILITLWGSLARQGATSGSGERVGIDFKCLSSSLSYGQRCNRKKREARLSCGNTATWLILCHKSYLQKVRRTYIEVCTVYSLIGQPQWCPTASAKLSACKPSEEGCCQGISWCWCIYIVQGNGAKVVVQVKRGIEAEGQGWRWLVIRVSR